MGRCLAAPRPPAGGLPPSVRAALSSGPCPAVERWCSSCACQQAQPFWLNPLRNARSPKFNIAEFNRHSLAQHRRALHRVHRPQGRARPASAGRRRHRADVSGDNATPRQPNGRNARSPKFNIAEINRHSLAHCSTTTGLRVLPPHRGPLGSSGHARWRGVPSWARGPRSKAMPLLRGHRRPLRQTRPLLIVRAPCDRMAV